MNGERPPHKYPELSWRGGRYFKVEERSNAGKVKDYVVYEDKQSSRSCIDFTQAKTFLTFKGCDGCNIDYIYASDNILTNKKCRGSTMENFAISQIKNDRNREDNKTFCIFYPENIEK